MTAHARDLAAYGGLDGRTTSRPRRVLQYTPLDLAAPPMREIAGLPLEGALALWRSMVLTARPGEGVLELLSAQGTCRGFQAVRPVEIRGSRSCVRDQVRVRLHHAVLGPASPAAEEWRARRGLARSVLHVARKVWVPWHDVPSRETEEAVSDLLVAMTGELRDSHNPQHPTARAPTRATLAPTTRGWWVTVFYGYTREDSSSWKVSHEVDARRSSVRDGICDAVAAWF